MNKYLYPIYKLKVKSWIKYWLFKKTSTKEEEGVLSDILTGFTFNLINTVQRKFNIFNLYGNSVQKTTSIAEGDEYDSPSPDHPQPINSAGDNVNLFDKDNPYASPNKALNDDGDIITASGYLVYKISLKVNTTYTFQKNNTASTYIRIVLMNSNDEKESLAVSANISTIGTYTKTFTTTNTTSYAYIQIKTTDENIKLVEGTNAGGYSSYGMGSITVKIVNGNLWDKNNITIVWGKGYNSSGEWVSYSGADWGGNNYKDIPLNENTAYILSGKLVSSGYTSRFHFFDINGNFISAENKVNTGGVDVYTFTTPSKARYLSIQAYKPYYNTDTIQIEEGSTATPYVAHAEQNFIIPVQQPMREIGKEDGSTAKDGFIKENNNWLERHWVKRLILTGDETVTTMSTYCYKISNIQNGYSNNISLKGIKCLYFKEKTQGSVYGGSQGIAILGGTTNALYISFGTNSEINTATKFKAKLKEYYDSGTPIYVDYLANEPTDLPCTEEQVAILENLPHTYNEETNVYSVDTVSPYIQIQYYEKEGDQNG